MKRIIIVLSFLFSFMATAANVQLGSYPPLTSGLWASGDKFPMIQISTNSNKIATVADFFSVMIPYNSFPGTFDARYVRVGSFPVDLASQVTGLLSLNKLTALTANRAVITNGSGVLASGNTTAAQIDFLKTLTSDVQAQINAINSSNPITTINVSSPITSTGGSTPTLAITKSDSTHDGYLAFTDFVTFFGKEPAISSGTTSQYWRGDKTFQDFNTSARAALSAISPLSYNISTGVISLPGFTETQILRIGTSRTYTTIQSALTAIGNSASAADVKKPFTIYIEPGSYDESLTIPLGRIITLVAQGTVILGDGAGANWSSTVPRSITFTANNADVFGSDIKPALTIMAVPAADSTTTFVAESGAFFVSGDINVNGSGLSHTLNLNSVKVAGIINKSATGLTNLQGYRWINIGAVSMPTSTILERCFECEFDALVTVDSFNSVTDSEFKAGMTVATISNTLPPSGFFNTTFSGTFTGPANSLKLDATSNYFFNATGATLGGSATKVLQSLIGTNSITEESNLFYTDARSRAAISVVSPVSYNSTTGVISEAASTNSVDGYLTAADHTIFNSKEPAISSGTTSQYWRGDKTFVDFNTSARGAISVVSPASYNSTTGIISILQSSASQNGYLSSTDWSTFNSKEPAISSGTTSQYWRGDKSFQTLDTLAVTENTNQYFTTARARASFSVTAPLTYSSTTGNYSMPAAIDSQNGYMTSTDHTSLTNLSNGSYPYSPSSPSTWTSVIGSIPAYISKALDSIIQYLSTLTTSSGWYVDATIIGTSGQQELGSSAQTAWTVAADHTDFTLANASWPGATSAKIACASGEVPTGNTCSTSETLGMGFIPPTNCDFEVCADFTHYMNTTTGVTTAVSNIDATFAIIETPSNAVTVTNLGQSHQNSSFDVPLNASNRSDFGAPHRPCGSFQGRTTFSTFRVAYKKTADSNSNSNAILTFLGTNRGDANVRFRAHCLK